MHTKYGRDNIKMDALGDVAIDGRIISEWILRE
jgi:hypothetical protein